jgi:hypothetical protein
MKRRAAGAGAPVVSSAAPGRTSEVASSLACTSEDNNQAQRYERIWLSRRLQLSRELAAVIAYLLFKNRRSA